MANVRDIKPRKDSEQGTSRAVRPFTHGMDEFFENLFPRRWMEGFMEPHAWRRPLWSEFETALEGFPRVDVVDKGETLRVRAELPGVEKDDLEITINGDRLTIEAKREYKEEEKEEAYFRNEMAYGRIARTIYLPVDVEGDKAKADLKKGILEITLPKVKATKAHTVKVA
ncbi:Hsp20/alpha crystallin family protein [Lentisalinibacter salinarum]|uniref:Hsp20/alpha crystallin family protein n=1 Tax=Lentisalinibacter salinarum TaxID=2992239 RepID=UPI00386AC35C